MKNIQVLYQNGLKVRAEALEEGRLKEREQGIKNLLEVYQEMGLTKDISERKLCQKYHLSEEEAKRYIHILGE